MSLESPIPYELRSTSRSSAVVNDIVIHATGSTRLVLRPELVVNPSNPEAGVKITLVHQRKRAADAWEDIPSVSLSTVRANEEVKLALHSEATLKLYQELRSLFEIHTQSGVVRGVSSLVVAPADEVVRTTVPQAEILRTLIEQDRSDEVWTLLSEIAPDKLIDLSFAHIQSQRESILHEFELSIEAEHDENYWQDFFEKHQWIFGYGLKYQILRQIVGQPHYGGQNVYGTGDQRGDFLTATEGDLRFSVLVEIKRPQTPLLSVRYRNGAYLLTKDALGGVMQLQANCHTWEVYGSEEPHTSETLQRAGVHTIAPRGILVIGRASELDDHDKRQSFERFRASLSNIDILTFDELLSRARFIVGVPFAREN